MQVNYINLVRERKREREREKERERNNNLLSLPLSVAVLVLINTSKQSLRRHFKDHVLPSLVYFARVPLGEGDVCIPINNYYNTRHLLSQNMSHWLAHFYQFNAQIVIQDKQFLLIQQLNKKKLQKIYLMGKFRIWTYFSMIYELLREVKSIFEPSSI